jgi:phosphohistidine phosphatase
MQVTPGMTAMVGAVHVTEASVLIETLSLSQAFSFLIMRHATADPRELMIEDADRCLIEKGRQQAIRAGQFLLRHALWPDHIFSSPYPRALQTAQLVAKQHELAPKIDEIEALAPEGGWTAANLLQKASAYSLSLWVGHEPDLSLLLAELLRVGEWHMPLKKASLTMLSFVPATEHTSARVLLDWHIPIRLMPKVPERDER